MGDNALDFLRKKIDADEEQQRAVQQLIALTNRQLAQPTDTKSNEASAVQFLANLTLKELRNQNGGR